MKNCVSSRLETSGNRQFGQQVSTFSLEKVLCLKISRLIGLHSFSIRRGGLRPRRRPPPATRGGATAPPPMLWLSTNVIQVVRRLRCALVSSFFALLFCVHQTFPFFFRSYSVPHIFSFPLGSSFPLVSNSLHFEDGGVLRSVGTCCASACAEAEQAKPN